MLTPGQIFAGCRIDGVAGQGGMGVVYRATQLSLDRTVALKLIAPHYADDAMFRERFLREARIAASIDHPCVAPVHEAGEFEGSPYLIMRFIDGEDLSEVLAREGRLLPARAARITEQVGAALEAAHHAGLVHRDVKPANVMLTRARDGSEHVYLTDFGLTRPPERTHLTGTGQFIGTPDYMAPEQLQDAPITSRVDVYSLGCVLYEMLTGRIPFAGDSAVRKLWAHVNDPPPRPSDAGAPAAFDVVVATAMAKDPAERYDGPAELGRAAVAAAGLTATDDVHFEHREPSDAPATAPAPAAPVLAPPPGAPRTEVAGSAPAAPTSVDAHPVAAPAGIGTPPGDGPPAQRGRGRGRMVATVLVALLVIAGGATAAVLLSRGDGRTASNGTDTANTAVTDTSVTDTGSTDTVSIPTLGTDTSSTAVGVDPRDGDAILASFADAYSREDPQLLSTLLADDVVRVDHGNNSIEQRWTGRAAVERVYADEWAASPGTVDYVATFDGSSMKADGSRIIVRATYTVGDAAGGRPTGDLSLTLSTTNDNLQITRIDSYPYDAAGG